MPALQVKDCPDHVYQQLRDCAREENRSISQQALTIIESYLKLYKASGLTLTAGQGDWVRLAVQGAPVQPNIVEERKKIFEELAKLPPLNNAPDSAELLAQIRTEEAR